MALVHSYESTGPKGLGKFLLPPVSSFVQQRSGPNSSCHPAPSISCWRPRGWEVEILTGPHQGQCHCQQLKLSPIKGLSVEMTLRGQQTVRVKLQVSSGGEKERHSALRLSPPCPEDTGGPPRREIGKLEVSRCSGKHSWASFMVQRAGETQMVRLRFWPVTSPQPPAPGRETDKAVPIKCARQKHSTSHVCFKLASSHVCFFFFK